MTHICVSKQTIIGSDNGLSPGRRQAIIWTNAEIVLIGTLGTNFSEILIEIRIFSFKKMGLIVSPVKWLPCCLGLNELKLLLAVGNLLTWHLIGWQHSCQPIIIYVRLLLLANRDGLCQQHQPLYMTSVHSSYLGLTRSISWLLMPWLLTSPGHQQPWYWLCKICRSWSYLSKDSKYLCHINGQ